MLAAAVLLFLIGLAHSYLGERYILIRLFRRDLPRLFGGDEFTKKTLRFAWHITTVAWWGMAALLVAGLDSAQTSLRIISITFLVTGVIALAGSRGRHLSWIVFLAVAGLTWWAS
ncbi:MAG: hypothetical protein AAGI08_15835 [Bacteroidota bacterium]